MDPNTPAGESVRQRFFANSRRKSKPTKFGEVELVVKELSAAAIAKFVPLLQGEDYEAKQKAIAELAVLCTYDTEGNLVFEPEDAARLLADLGTTEFGEFCQDVMEVNARTPAALEESGKNSEAQTSNLLSD